MIMKNKRSLYCRPYLVGRARDATEEAGLPFLSSALDAAVT